MFLDNFNFVFAKGRMQPPPPPPTPVIAIHKILTTVRWGGIWGVIIIQNIIYRAVCLELLESTVCIYFYLYFTCFFMKSDTHQRFLKKALGLMIMEKGAFMKRGVGCYSKKGEGAPIRRKRVGLLMKNEKEACVNVCRCLPMSVSITRLVYLPDAYRIG